MYVASEFAVLSFVCYPLVDQLSNLERLIRVFLFCFVNMMSGAGCEMSFSPLKINKL